MKLRKRRPRRPACSWRTSAWPTHVQSTCPHALAFGFSGGGGSLAVVVPALAATAEVTVVDRLRDPSGAAFVLRSACSAPGKEVVFEAVERMKGGFTGVNTVLRRAMTDWLSATLKKAIGEEGITAETKLGRRRAYRRWACKQRRLRRTGLCANRVLHA